MNHYQRNKAKDEEVYDVSKFTSAELSEKPGKYERKSDMFILAWIANC